jgi:hypothetical protein
MYTTEPGIKPCADRVVMVATPPDCTPWVIVIRRFISAAFRLHAWLVGDEYRRMACVAVVETGAVAESPLTWAEAPTASAARAKAARK